jgi:hypothetical protein
MLAGGAACFASGGTLFAVLGTRAVYGAFRHSVHRTGLELVYLALPASVRDRARPIIDGAMTRLAQAVAAGSLLLLARLRLDSPRELAFVVTAGAFGWVGAAVSLRAPYVAVFRRALLGAEAAEPRSAEELDLASVELLIEALASPRPREVVAAMGALARRGRAGLIPALVLLRDEEEVIEPALEIFGGTARGDWIRLAERLLADRRARVRRSAMRALARTHHASPTDGTDTADGAAGGDLRQLAWVRGYLAIAALDGGDRASNAHLALLAPNGDGYEARLGMLTALSDAAPHPGLAAAVVDIVDRSPEPRDRETIELLARAAASVRATELVPRLVELLAFRDRDSSATPHGVWRGTGVGRSRVRAALASLGERAFEHTRAALLRPETPRGLRLQLPLALAEFGTQEASDVLLRFVQRGDDGLVRYRCLRALARIATEHGVRLPAGEVRAMARGELTEHFRLKLLRRGLAPAGAPLGTGASDTMGIALALLDEKADQALARTFHLLKLCFPSEDLEQVHAAVTSGIASKRANAAEFLDALLAGGPRRRGDDGLREWLRLLFEDLTDNERVARAAAWLPDAAPAGAQAAIAMMGVDRDRMLVAMASSLAEELAALGVPERPLERSRPAIDGEPALAGPLRPAGAHGG